MIVPKIITFQQYSGSIQNYGFILPIQRFFEMKLLIIEDEKDLSDSIVSYFQEEQYVCETAMDYQTALEKIDLFHYDCILLDINLPGGSGLKLLEILRKDKNQDSVIIISARDSLDDKISGLHLGADDYLAKPFHLSELSARIASVIRRKYAQGNNILEFGDLTIDLLSQTVLVDEKTIDLTPTEYQLLLFLVNNKNRVVSKNAIAMHILGDEAEWLMQYDTIYAHIKNLKRKMTQAGCRNYIQSRYGMGYKIEVK